MSVTPTQSLSSKEERSHLRLVSLAGFASMASMRLCDPMLVELAREFNVTTGSASRVVSAFAIAYGVMQLLYGPLGDRFGKQRVISIAVLACALLSALTALAPNLAVLIGGRALMGAAAAGIIPLAMAWIGDQVAYERRQETLAKLMGATVSGMMVGLWFGAMASETVGWRAAFWVMSGVFGFTAVLLYKKVQQQHGAVVPLRFSESVRNTTAILAIPRVRWVLTVVCIEGALVFGAMAFIPTHLHQQFGFSVSASGSVMMLYGVGGLAYSQFARRWLAFLGERGLVLMGALCIGFGLVLLAWSHVALMGMMGCFATGLGFYMLHNTLQTQATQMAPQSRGTAVTLFACLLFFGQSAGVFVMAFSVDLDFLPITFSLAAFGILVLGSVISRKVGLKVEATT